MRSSRVRGYYVGDGFGLREIHSTVHERTPRELARFGSTRSVRYQQREYASHDIGRSVRRDLYRVLARVGVRRAEHGDQNVIYRLVAVDYVAVMNRRRRGIR